MTHKYLQGRAIIQRLSGDVIPFVSRCRNERLIHLVKVHFLCQSVFLKKPIGIFIQRALGRRAGVRKKNRDVMPVAQRLPIGEFLPTIKRDGLEQISWDPLKPLVQRDFNIACLASCRLQGDDDFRQPFDERDHRTFVASTHNGVAFDVPELFLERRIIGFPFGNMLFECQLSATFLVAIGFSFPFHRQCRDIKDLIFEHAVKCSYRTIDCCFCMADNDIRRPTLRHFVLNIIELFLRKDHLSSSAVLFVFLYCG